MLREYLKHVEGLAQRGLEVMIFEYSSPRVALYVR